jgi:uncharacterized membrane protein
MLILKMLWPRPLAVSPRFLYVLGGLSFLGFLDASFLTAKHYLGGTVPCSFGQQCEVVLNSTYSSLWGMPVAIFGALFYLFVLVSVFFVWETGKKEITGLLLPAGFLAFLASLYFVYLQFFVIHAFCQYCLFSALLSTTIFIVALSLHFKKS